MSDGWTACRPHGSRQHMGSSPQVLIVISWFLAGLEQLAGMTPPLFQPQPLLCAPPLFAKQPQIDYAFRWAPADWRCEWLLGRGRVHGPLSKPVAD